MLQLKDCTNDKQALWLVEGCYSLGSESDQDIQVQATEKAALIDVTGDKVFIEPFHAGAVQINDVTIAARHILVAGDKLLVGRTEFILLDPKRDVVEKPALSAVDDATEERHGLITQRFVLTSEDNPAEAYPLSFFTRVGRSPDCDIVVESPKLSRHHAELMQDTDGMTVVDLDSSNGTYINGKRIKRAVLAPGDTLSLAGSVFSLSVSEHEAVLDNEQTTLRPAINMADLSPRAARDVEQKQPPKVKPKLPLDATHMPEAKEALPQANAPSDIGRHITASTEVSSTRGTSVVAIALVGLAVLATAAYLVYAQW